MRSDVMNSTVCVVFLNSLTHNITLNMQDDHHLSQQLVHSTISLNMQ